MAGQDLEVGVETRIIQMPWDPELNLKGKRIPVGVEGEVLAPGFWHQRPHEYYRRVAHMGALAECWHSKRPWTLVVDSGVELLPGFSEEVERLNREVLSKGPGPRLILLGAVYTGEVAWGEEGLGRSRGVTGAWGYLVENWGAWRLHEHLAYWPLLSMDEGVKELSEIVDWVRSTKKRVLVPSQRMG